MNVYGKLLSTREYIMKSYFPNGNFIYLYIRTLCVVIRLFKLALQRVHPRTERWSFHSDRMIIGHRSFGVGTPPGAVSLLDISEKEHCFCYMNVTAVWHGLMFNSFVGVRLFKLFFRVAKKQTALIFYHRL